VSRDFVHGANFQDENITVVANASRMTQLDVPPVRAIGSGVPHRYFRGYADT